MSLNIEILLGSFSNKELAYFYKYRWKLYTKESLKEIENIVFNKRKLDLRKIENLTIEKISKYGSCLRCGSVRKIYYDVEYFPFNFKILGKYNSEDFQTNIIKKEQAECLICGFIIKNPNEIGIFRSIVVFFKKKFSGWRERLTRAFTIYN